MFNRFCMTQNLCALFHPDCLPHGLQPIIEDYDNAFGTSIRGTLRNDVLAFADIFNQEEARATSDWTQASRLSDEFYALLKAYYGRKHKGISRYAIARRHIKRLGDTYQIHSSSIGDSHVKYQVGEDEGLGSIMGIFSHKHDPGNGSQLIDTFLVIQNYDTLSQDHIPKDKLRSFDTFGGRLVLNRYSSQLVLVKIQDVVCHLAHLPLVVAGIPEECAMVVPLQKVSDSLWTSCTS